MFIKAILHALARFVEGDLPGLEDFARAVLSDPNLRVTSSESYSDSKRDDKLQILGDNVSIMYAWTKRDENQAETLEVKLLGRRGIFTATFVNYTLRTLTMNGRRTAPNQLKGNEESIRRMLVKVRALEDQ